MGKDTWRLYWLQGLGAALIAIGRRGVHLVELVAHVPDPLEDREDGQTGET